MEASIYNQEGKTVGSVALPEKIFGLPWNGDLVHQVVVAMQANARTPIAHTKNRGEVRGGGKKPWKQKGTGRARHGSSRSPIWRGGGITFGPRKERDFSMKINKKMRTKALYTALSRKWKDKEIVFVDSISLGAIKTKHAKEVMQTLFDKGLQKKKNAILLALPERNAAVEKSFRNFGNVEVIETRNLNPMDVVTYRMVAIIDPKASLASLQSRSAK
jgi:large subunit ribosomal protein L4